MVKSESVLSFKSAVQIKVFLVSRDTHSGYRDITNKTQDVP